jgi:hypothetical protein
MMRLRAAWLSAVPAHHLAGMIAIEISWSEFGELSEDFGPEIGDDPFADPVDEIVPRRAGNRDDDADADERQEVVVDQR